MSLKYRLVTRSDFDGLVCAVLLKELNLIDEILFVHPKDMQDGKITVSHQDITTNLPYVPGVHLAFDHHASETLRDASHGAKNHIIDPNAPSAARVVYNHFGGASAFPNISAEMMDAVDKSDSAQFSKDEILNPQGWVLLNFLMDARTGLGRFKHFTISNYQLMMELIDYCRNHSIEEILRLPHIQERVTLFHEHQTRFEEQLRRCSKVHGNVVTLDLRHEETIFAGNRFMIYALYPDCNVSVHILWGLRMEKTVFAIGASIINRSCNTHIGELCLKYHGGGHFKAGTCQIENDHAEIVLNQILFQLREDHKGEPIED